MSKSYHKIGRFVVISAELIPEAQEVEDSRLEREIREGLRLHGSRRS